MESNHLQKDIASEIMNSFMGEMMLRLGKAYHAGPVDGKDGDYAEFEKIKAEFVAGEWWGYE